MGSKAEGLRSRKKANTQRSIEKAALELALERGIDAATVDAICKRAGVSRMTFFNYFPSKASVFTGRLFTFPSVEEMVDLIEQSNAPSYFDAILEIGLNRIPAFDNSEIACLRRQVMDKSPEIALQQRSHEVEAHRVVLEALKRYLENRPEERIYPALGVEEEASVALHLTSALHRIAYLLALKTGELSTPSELRKLAGEYLAASEAGKRTE